jgi:hypothetical protein
LDARFLVNDAMALSFPDASFDVVWSIEAGPHMPDKAIFAKNYCGSSNRVASWLSLIGTSGMIAKSL